MDMIIPFRCLPPCASDKAIIKDVIISPVTLMKRSNLLPIVLMFLAILIALIAQPAAMKAAGQAYYYTPTPGPDGKIIYTAGENDSCTSVALKNQISPDQLTKLNDLWESDCEPGATLEPGRQLVIANVAGQPTATLTPTPSGPTPTPYFGSGTICVYLYDDQNANAIQDAGESMIPGGEVGLVTAGSPLEPPITWFIHPSTGQAVSALTAAGDQPVCFDELPEGDYIVLAASLPENYNPTTNQSYPYSIKAGETLVLRFGATSPQSHMPPDDGGNGSSWMPLLAAGLLILGGIGLGAYFLLLRRNSR